ncbi:CNNM family magnesium/cobalt transport protein CorC [Gallaecimonas pentaromativorans]|uniref:Magnesium and cobalt efflux protein CorC n=1 Tax=Gallaecimonas pentaromativorans TaxID=584787 RepID=A0A3N1PD18_9GAMM|nr:CNNM family magnesium/cobalt transport protein CorC [Gallaecimonas pentaromativorans]ROQ25979.1 magnesium and cobalt transporter [Gallaecimonas pentaromativorans]
MSDDNPHSSQGSSKSWLERISHFFSDEPKNRDDLMVVIESATERELIDVQTKDMLQGVLDVSELRVRDIMIPRSQIVAIDKSQGVQDFLPTIIESAHSRFPIINEDKDHIEGILLAKDLLKYAFGQAEAFDLDKVKREAVIVPESKRVDVLLKEFRSGRFHMAIVVDEFGGVSGLVTIEDILEEIVGDIEDEYDAEDDEGEEIRKLTNRTFAVAALTSIEDFNDHFASHFSDEDVDTIGGLVMHAFGHLPARGESVVLGGLQFKVTRADKRRLIQLQVTLPEEQG